MSTEVIRLAEEPVLNTGGEPDSLVGSSPTASARCNHTWAHGPTARRWSCKPEIRVRFPMSPLQSRGPVATTSGLHPDNDGSSPSGTFCLAWDVGLCVGASFARCMRTTRERHPDSQPIVRRAGKDLSRSSLECSPPCHGGDVGSNPIGRAGRIESGESRVRIKAALNLFSGSRL